MKHEPSSLRWLILLALVAGQALCVGFGPPTLAARDFDDTPLWPQQVRQLCHMALPEMGATAALLLETGTQSLLFEKGVDQRLAPASTTKMMTALVALERGNLSDKVTVQQGDLNVESIVSLSAGEVWTLEDLLYALLLPSDNAAAVAIARHVGGSEAAFVGMMNEQAARWGLQNTHFVNPHGYDDPRHYSSARDLAEIARHGLANPVFARIVATREKRVGSRTLVNLNQLLGSYEGTLGVKTGTTDQAGQCLVSAVERPDGQLICVILGSNDRYRDTRLLLDYYYANYSTVPLRMGPKGLNVVRWADGKDEVLVLQDSREVLLARWQLPWLRVLRIGQATGNSEPAGPVATARFTVGAANLAELPLYLSAP